MRSVLSFFSMLALGLMIAAVFMVAPSGNGTVTNIAGFEFGEPTLDYRSVVAGLGIGSAHRGDRPDLVAERGAHAAAVWARRSGAAPLADRLGGGVRRRAVLLLSAGSAAA